jgi:hypothetical protein
MVSLNRACCIYVPHASEKLDETAIAKGESDDDVRRADALGVHVD